MNETIFYQIEAYLRGELTPEEKATLETELVGNRELADQLAIQREQRKVVELLIEDDLRAELPEWKKKLSDEQERGAGKWLRNRWFWWCILAMVAFLSAITYFLKTEKRSGKPDTSTPPEIIEEPVIASPNIPVLQLENLPLRSADGSIESDRKSIVLIIYGQADQPVYTFYRDTLSLWLPGDNIKRNNQIECRRAKEQTGAPFFLILNGKQYPISESVTKEVLKPSD